MRSATDGREIVALSFGSQLDGVVAAREDGEPLQPALIWCDRRAGAECDAAAERIDPERLRELTGCNLDPGHIAPKIAWLAAHEPDVHAGAHVFAPPGSWVAWKATGELAVDPTNGSSTGLLDPRTHAWSDEACAAFDVDPDRLPPVRRSDAVLGPVLGWLCEATGLSPETLVVLGAGDEMAATLGAGVVEPGAVCDVLGTAEPVCAVVGEPAHDPTGVVELHPHADPDTWLLENPGWLSGGAYRWFRDELGGLEAVRATESGADVYELLNALGRDLAARRRRRAVGAGARGRDGAGVERRRARRLVRPDRLARPRPPRPRAARGQRARAARRDRGDRRCRPRPDRGGVRRRRRARAAAARAARARDRAAGVPARGRRDDRPRRRDARRGRRGAAPERGRGRAARWRARARSRSSPTRSCAALYDDLHRRHRQLYDALRPLFNGA